jgi:hypothetical protein
MEIILFEKRYRIDVENIVLKLESQLLINLKNTPGVTQSEVKNYPKDIRGMFKNQIVSLLYKFQNLDEITTIHTDYATNIDANLRNDFTGDFMEDFRKFQEIDLYQYFKELATFSHSFQIAFISFFFPFAIESPNSLPDKFEENTNLTVLKELKEFSDKTIPNYKREKQSPFFDFLNDHIKLLNPPELSKSILVTRLNKTEFEDYLDHIFPGDEILNKEVKKRFKSWFHYSKNQQKDIEPIYFEEDDDQPYYVAYFLKFSGITQEKKTKFNVLSYIKKSNKWLDNNLLSRKSESRFSKFAELEDSLTKYSREIVKKVIDANLEDYKIQNKNPK